VALRAGGLLVHQLPPKVQSARIARAMRAMPASSADEETGSARGIWPPPWKTTSCSTRCCPPEALLYRLFH